MRSTGLGADKRRELPRPGPIGLAVRTALGALMIYFFVALLTKWGVFVRLDPIESDRYYTAFTLWLLPYVFSYTFGWRWGPWPSVVFVAVGAVLGVAGYVLANEWWNPVLAGWVYAGDLLVFGALAVSFPVAVATRSPGCELRAIPWFLAKRRGTTEGQPRPACAIGLDYLDRWEARRR
jgi:hypothetical protein